MKVSELPEDTNLTLVKVRLPDDVYQEFQKYAGGEKEMYIAGGVMMEFFMSPHSKDHIDENGESYRQLYLLPPQYTPSQILDWEVASIDKEKIEEVE